MNKNNDDNIIDNFEQFIKPIINTIFENIPNYIDEKKNIYNIDFICTIKFIYEFLYRFISNYSTEQLEKKRVIIFNIFKENFKYIYQLIQICPTYGNPNDKLYIKENHIIIFNDEKKFVQINFMKYNIFSIFESCFTSFIY